MMRDTQGWMLPTPRGLLESSGNNLGNKEQDFFFQEHKCILQRLKYSTATPRGQLNQIKAAHLAQLFGL